MYMLCKKLNDKEKQHDLMNIRLVFIKLKHTKGKYLQCKRFYIEDQLESDKYFRKSVLETA